MKKTCTLKTMLAQNLRHSPDKPALIENDRQVTFRELAERSHRIGNALLALGLLKGERVAILGRNSIENAESYFSIPNTGLVLVMLNFRLAPAEIQTILSDSQAAVLIVHDEYIGHISRIRDRLSWVRHIIHIGAQSDTPDGWLHYETLIGNASPFEAAGEIKPDDLAALMYTSGTTGTPKGCMVLQRNLYHVGRSTAQELRMERHDVGILPTPLFHASGLVVLMNGIYSGCTTIIMPSWDVEGFMRLVEKHEVTTGMLATPMLLYFVNHPSADRYKLGSLKKILFAGAPVTPVVFQRAIERFGNIFIHAFGATETVGSVTILKTDVVKQALAEGRREILYSCGSSYADMQVEVVKEDGSPLPPGDVGEIRVRGLGTTQGYWHKEEETRRSFRGGWYYTEDLGRADERGLFYVVGRKKDMIITGGENVIPAEVENALYKHPAVAQAAVIGLADELWGESVTAFIVIKIGVQVDEGAIRSFCRDEIAGYKVPKKVIFLQSLPTSASGKLMKNKLKEMFAAQLATA